MIWVTTSGVILFISTTLRYCQLYCCSGGVVLSGDRLSAFYSVLKYSVCLVYKLSFRWTNCPFTCRVLLKTVRGLFLSNSTAEIDCECVNEVVYWVQCVRHQLGSGYLCNEQTCSGFWREHSKHLLLLFTIEVYQKTHTFMCSVFQMFQ